MSPVVPKKERVKFTIPGKYLLFILSVLSVALILITTATDVLNTRFFTSVESALAPMERGLSNLGAWLSARSDDLASIRSLQLRHVRRLL